MLPPSSIPQGQWPPWVVFVLNSVTLVIAALLLTFFRMDRLM